MKVRDYVEIKISKGEIERIVERKVQDELNSKGVPGYVESLIRVRLSELRKRVKELENKLKEKEK